MIRAISDIKNRIKQLEDMKFGKSDKVKHEINMQIKGMAWCLNYMQEANEVELLIGLLTMLEKEW